MDKTKITECMIKQKRGRTPRSPPELAILNDNQEQETLRYSNHCWILGTNIQNNLTWLSHLETGKKALLPDLRKHLGALRQLGKKIPRDSWNTLARGLIVSRLTYLTSIWGGTTENQIGKAHIILNAAAKWVTGKTRKYFHEIP